MTLNTLARYRLYFIGSITIAIWSLLAWNYFHHRIPSHHLFGDPNLPSVSNAWGALLLPLLTTYLSYRIQKRVTANSTVDLRKLRQALWGFVIAAVYSISIALAFSLGHGDISNLLFMALLVMALILPLYQPQFYLGFILGLTYFFGAVLPTLIGSVIVLVSAVFAALKRVIIHKFKKVET